MDPYDICSACSCFIKTAETCCPFCGAAHRHVSKEPVRARRMSRAQWLALGSALALTSCGGITDGGHTGTQQSSQRGGDQGGVMATGTNCSPLYTTLLSTTFACAGQSCNAATQYCDISYDGTQIGCEDDNGGGYFPQQCLSCPTYDCVSQYISASCKCVDFGGGALGLGGGIGVGCAGCYGAPPTRLELLAA
jgi:hypothetical protein